MLRIAVQSKGRLYDETMLLLEEAGIKLNRGKRILLLSAKGFPVEVLFLRDDDIPQSVANGVADIGIVGENEYVEKGQEAKLIKRLGFSKCRLSLAIPKDEDYQGVEWFAGKTIATSYPEILKAYLAEKGVKADLHVISGSVEIAPGIGLADAIFDIVSSGSTLVSNQLKEVEVIMQSEALLIANNNLSDEKQAIRLILQQGQVHRLIYIILVRSTTSTKLETPYGILFAFSIALPFYRMIIQITNIHLFNGFRLIIVWGK